MTAREPRPAGRDQPLPADGPAPATDTTPAAAHPAAPPADTPARAGTADVHLVIAAGGAVGGLARWGIGELLPTRGGAVPWGTLLVNTAGCFLLGLVMVGVLQVWRPGRYLRPFLAVGVLGGFTTFSTYSAEVRDLLATAHYARAVSYAVGSLAAGLLAVSLGVAMARALAGLPTGSRAARARREAP
jgi:fluoride exporter